MNHSNPTGFGQFVPGFEFLQKLAQGAATPGPMAGWLSPTLDPQALDKRIEELKAVQFWLDQNATALKATIQALEVQKMTLATLGSMNVNLAELAAKAQPPAAPPVRDAAPKGPAKAAAQPAAKPAAAITPDPMQYWGALTRQFQQIAATALQDVAQRSAAAPAPVKAAAASRKAPTPAAPARPAAKKTTARPRSRKPAP